MKVLVSGSSGLIGTALISALQAAGHSPVRLVRGPAEPPGEISWDIGASRLDPGSLTGMDAVVHLAGAGIAEHRWSDEYKRVILDSRVAGTALLVHALLGCFAGLYRKFDDQAEQIERNELRRVA